MRLSSGRDDLELVGAPIGRLYTWWRGDPLPGLPRVPGLVIEPATDLAALAAVAGHSPAVLQTRMAEGHTPYLAWLDGTPVASGWLATREAAIGELGLAFALPPGNRYLWDFVTLPPWRGRGIYPRILQDMLRRETSAQRFWVGHDLDNVASARGILKAGFVAVGEVGRQRGGGLGLVPRGQVERGAAAAALLGIPILQRTDTRSG